MDDQAFAARDRESARLAEQIGYEAVAHRRSWMYVEKARVIHDICLSVMAGGMLIWAISMWRAGTVSAGDVVLVSALTFRILHGSRDLALTLVDATQQLGAIADTLQIILQPHAIVDADAPLALAQGDVRFEEVRFAYPDRAAVLDGLNLHIPAGKKVGIVGPSGAGKSTLIALIQRLDDVQSGRVLIDGQDIRSVSQDSLREKMRWSRRKPRCSIAALPTTSATAARRPAMRRCRTRRGTHSAMASSVSCRRATRPRSANAGSCSPVVSASVWASPARF
ncbi:hypothetical protein XPR_2315 [Xanthomonas arboricola pv. pruni MAFF 301420]|uniref:ABC transmembrane type-1 domain-containing protein n=1 Tax=Xanthomonas arboricola pv. pruni MAFF 301420 TaxID=1418095 RepID=W4SGG1_9XANT|nr:hypothetical protein XPR_2315 [Xanthomonas arboricola pv. pruni MAFF 301420]GAE61017.1 hypothetical protein XPN_2923 [Xanthomonas arboricola pv. pruni MAFF 301427]